jgi:hypothetical protein
MDDGAGKNFGKNPWLKIFGASRGYSWRLRCAISRGKIGGSGGEAGDVVLSRGFLVVGSWCDRAGELGGANRGSWRGDGDGGETVARTTRKIRESHKDFVISIQDHL